ncbi:MAG: L,D-transpeptidase [Gemmatimonadota bacterium]
MKPPRPFANRLATLVVPALFALGAAAVPLEGQSLAFSSPRDSDPPESEKNALERGRYAVLIDLDENRLYFKQGDLTLWSAPVGTGTGMRVITNDDDWEFTTPTGRFQVQYKELNPVWIAPDWFFVENNLPVPPVNHPSRYMTRTLGDAAVYISPSLAIHGTDRPELIGQRVSHGCIRLENRFAKRLYQNVQVGTEVIIVGGEKVKESARVVDLRKGYDPSLASRGGKKPLPRDPVYEAWLELDTDDLVEEIDDQLDEDPEESRWDEAGIILAERAQTGDREALEALFRIGGALPTRAIEREWGTLLAETYRRAPVRMLEAIGDLDLRDRRRVADMMVDVSLTLFGGELEAASAPWPTARVPRDVVTRRGERGWESLAAAERDHRERILTAAAEARD